MINRLDPRPVALDIASAQRVIAVGDVHGQIDLLRTLIEEEIKFSPADDVLIFLGDYIDRGACAEDEVETLNYLIGLYNANPGRVLLLKGNHEDMAEKAVGGSEEFWQCWSRNGAGGKLGWADEHLQELVQFCRALPLYYETDRWLFIHAGARDHIPLEKQSYMNLLWDKHGNQEGYFGKQLVVGHTIGQQVRVTPQLICVDTGAFYYGTLSAYDVRNAVVYSACRQLPESWFAKPAPQLSGASRSE